MMVWLAKMSLAPIVDLPTKEIGALLLISKFIMYQTTCFLIVVNNLLLNYDLVQMIVSPYSRNVRRNINWTNLIAAVIASLAYIILPCAMMNNILKTPNRIKLRQEDTVVSLLEKTMFIPDALLCVLYITFSIYVLKVLLKNYFYKGGFNLQIKEIIINHRITMTLLIMIFEGPFLLVMIRRAVDFFEVDEDWKQYS
jgi:hypothetical protein